MECGRTPSGVRITRLRSKGITLEHWFFTLFSSLEPTESGLRSSTTLERRSNSRSNVGDDDSAVQRDFSLVASISVSPNWATSMMARYTNMYCFCK